MVDVCASRGRRCSLVTFRNWYDGAIGRLRMDSCPAPRTAWQSRTAHELDGAMRMLSDGVRHGPQKKTRNRASPVRAKDDEISSPALCFVEDHLSWRAFDALTDDLDATRAGPFSKQGHGRLDNGAGDPPLIGKGLKMKGCTDEKRVRDKRDGSVYDEEHLDRAALRPGPTGDFRDGCVTAGGTVDGYQDFHERTSIR